MAGRALAHCARSLLEILAEDEQNNNMAAMQQNPWAQQMGHPTTMMGPPMGHMPHLGLAPPMMPVPMARPMLMPAAGSGMLPPQMPAGMMLPPGVVPGGARPGPVGAGSGACGCGLHPGPLPHPPPVTTPIVTEVGSPERSSPGRGPAATPRMTAAKTGSTSKARGGEPGPGDDYVTTAPRYRRRRHVSSSEPPGPDAPEAADGAADETAPAMSKATGTVPEPLVPPRRSASSVPAMAPGRSESSVPEPSAPASSTASASPMSRPPPEPAEPPRHHERRASSVLAE
eukprot:s571_g7.t1